MKIKIAYFLIFINNYIMVNAEVVDTTANSNHKSIYFCTYFGLMLPQSNTNEFSPAIGASIIPSLSGKLLLPIDIEIFYRNIEYTKKWVPRISLSLRYNTITTDQLTHFLQVGYGRQFVAEPPNFNISTGIIIQKIFIESRILIWRESGDNSSVINYSGLIFNVGIQL